MSNWMYLDFMTRIDEKTGEMKSPDGLRKVFLSYSHKDEVQLSARERVGRKILQDTDCAIWYDKHGLHAGEDYEKEINEAISQCDAVVLIVTPNVFTSDFIKEKEIGPAKKQGKPILAVIAYLTDTEKDMMKVEELLGGTYHSLMLNSADFDLKMTAWIKSHVDDSPEAQRIESLFLAGRHKEYGTQTMENRVLIASGYLYGIGTERDEEKGEKLLEYIAADPSDDEHTLKAVKMANRKLGLFNYYKGVWSSAFGKAAEYLSKVDIDGDKEVLGVLGTIYLFGMGGTEPNEEKGIEYIKRAAEDGNIGSMFQMGDMYELGIYGFEKSPEQAVEWFEQSAASGNSDAILRLFYIYKNNDELDPNKKQARRVLNMALEAGIDKKLLMQKDYMDAVEALGSIMVERLNQEDIDKLLDNMANMAENYGEFFEAKAEAGDIISIKMLGGLLYMQEDYANAAKWLEKAAEAGDVDSMYLLGEMYYWGEHYEQDCLKAYEWYIKAANAGQTDAAHALGKMYYFGEDIQQDYEKAAEWLEKAAVDNADAMFSLGVMHRDGEWFEKDDAAAFEWFEKAAGAGNTEGMVSLAEMYRDGRGTEQNGAKAVEWFEKAAEADDAGSMYLLGDMHYFGTGIQQDYAKAAEWYEKAAAEGDSDAMFSLGVMHRDGEWFEKDDAVAFEWFEKAAAKDNSDAMFSLGEMCRKGRGTVQDNGKAAEWYSKAIEAGFDDAEKLKKIQDWKDSLKDSEPQPEENEAPLTKKEIRARKKAAREEEKRRKKAAKLEEKLKRKAAKAEAGKKKK